MTQQTRNGWFNQCCLSEPSRPLTHTLGYAFRGILEAYLYSNNPLFLDASKKTADGFLKAMRIDGFLPGHILSDWKGDVVWACLTGTVQVAYCWLLLYQISGNELYRDAAYSANRFVRRTMRVSGAPEQCGGIKGAFPVDGAYHDYNYINWACKFFIDSNVLEREIRENEGKRIDGYKLASP